MPVAIHSAPFDARRRLAELGVSVEAIIKALEAGQLARVSCSFSPNARRETARIRNQFIAQGSHYKAPRLGSGNKRRVVRLDSRKISIVVASGDANTRRIGADPKTKHLKGLFTEALITRNKYIGGLFPETLSEELRIAVAILEHPTWILLIYITDDEIRAELSYPDEIKDGQIISWKERIFVPDTADDPGAVINPAEDDEPDIDVPVRRKAS